MKTHMSEQKIIIICIIIVVALGIILGILRPKEVLPYERISLAIGTVQHACKTTCNSSTTQSTTITLPAGVNGYTTTDAICLAQGVQLYCATCSCSITPNILFAPTVNTTTMSCTSSVDALGIIKITCN